MACLHESPAYAELHCLSNFSFLRGAAHPEELVERAAALGYAALAITDQCSLAGVVRAHQAAKEHGLKLIVGSEIRLADGPRLVLLAMDRAGYGKLSGLITQGRRRSAKGEYRLTRDDLSDGLPGCLALLIPDEGPLLPREGVVKARFQAPSPWQGEGWDGGSDPQISTIASFHPHPNPPPARGRGLLRRPPREKKTKKGDDSISWVVETFPNRAWLAVELHLGPDDTGRLEYLRQLGAAHGLPLVAAGDVHMHLRARRPLQDVLTAIRLGTTVQQAGYALYPNGERHLRPRRRLARIYPLELLAETLRVAERCRFSLDELRYEYPTDDVPTGETATAYLRRLTEAGIRGRWPDGTPDKVRRMVEHELAIIAELGYEPYFLTVHDIVIFARSQGILCQGRGSAANSAVCYCLGITAVDPARMEMLFERFVSRERNEPPDIDVDFEHERREEVIQYIYQKYGRERAALAATVITYRPKSALRDVGKALGLGLDQVDRLAGAYAWWDSQKWGQTPFSREKKGSDPIFEHLRAAGLDPASPLTTKLLELVREILGSPRHLSQHVGGFVIARDHLPDLVPIENAAMPERTVIQWDKDDLDALGLLKIDVLALGMLSAIRRAFKLIERYRGTRLTLADIPAEDPATYTMIQKADTVGVFQIESRAQMSMLPRLRPAAFYDLVIEVAIVRPGPIQGQMVHPYLRRRQGLEPVSYPSEDVRGVLQRTLGVPIFQEQVIKLAMVAAGFSAGEADQLRRAIGSWRRRDKLTRFQARLIEGMRKRGYPEQFAEQVFAQIQGFGEYGFPESHAASFALLAYASAWLKCREPAAFACALLNSQPMGFYAPAQLVQDARRHGVEVRPVDALASGWDCTLEKASSGQPALRLGLRLVKGLSREGAQRVVARRDTFFLTLKGEGMEQVSVPALAQQARLSRKDISALADSGALASLAGNRHQARWQALGNEPPLPLFKKGSEPFLDAGRPGKIPSGPKKGSDPFLDAIPLLPAPTEGQDLVADYAGLGLTLGRHPLALLRERLDRLGCVPNAVLGELEDGTPIRVAGLVVCRQHPSSASGVVFMTLEDETGSCNVIVWQRIVHQHRQEVLGARLLKVIGQIQREGEVIHVVAQRLEDHSPMLGALTTTSRDFR